MPSIAIDSIDGLGTVCRAGTSLCLESVELITPPSSLMEVIVSKVLDLVSEDSLTF